MEKFIDAKASFIAIIIFIRLFRFVRFIRVFISALLEIDSFVVINARFVEISLIGCGTTMRSRNTQKLLLTHT